MAFTTFTKDPQARLDYEVDWSEWLGTDTIFQDPDTDEYASSWTVPEDLTMATHSATDTKTKVWLEGGIIGGRYKVTNRITTTEGRTDERTIQINVDQK